VCAVIGAQAQASISKLPRTELYGHSYVRLEDWARAGNFSVRYTTGSPVVMVTNRWARLHFETDSRKCELDGITVHLSHPIAKRSGSAYITALDLHTAVQPVLFPPKNPPGKRIRTICLDAGHGGKDTGNVEGRLQEKNYTLRLAQEVRDVLTASGVKVVMTRSGDSFVELYDRPDIARRRGADLFISLHFNAFDSPSAQGLEVYCMTVPYTSSTNARGEGAGAGPYPGNRFDAKNVLLGYQLQKNLLRSLAVEDRGLRRARYAVLRSAEMPAVLIEGGFMTNPSEGRKIFDTKYRRQMAQAIVDGIKAYKELVEQ
jgi:N-acetylmuramoyl-L-alanine amidase